MSGYIETIRGKIGHDLLMIVGAGVFVHQNGRLLLQRRRDDGTWADHGGCIEIGETPEAAARREMLEETGLTAGKLEFIGIFSGEDFLHTYPNGDQIYLVGIYYLCEDFSGTPLIQTDETTDLRWFPVDALPAEISAVIRQPLHKCLEILQSRSCFT